jgi:hypothetical protein
VASHSIRSSSSSVAPIASSPVCAAEERGTPDDQAVPDSPDERHLEVEVDAARPAAPGDPIRNNQVVASPAVAQRLEPEVLDDFHDVLPVAADAILAAVGRGSGERCPDGRMQLHVV